MVTDTATSDIGSFKPRNTLVLLRIYPHTQKQVGRITVPANNQQEVCEAEVLAIGREASLTCDSESQCYDLAPGQRVLVKYQRRQQVGPNAFHFVPEGIPLAFVQDSTLLVDRPERTDGKLFLFDQTSVLAIVRQNDDIDY